MVTSKTNLQKSSEKKFDMTALKTKAFDRVMSYVPMESSDCASHTGILEAVVPPKETVIPTLDLDPLKFYESTYTAYGNSYDAPTLVQFAKDKGYPTFDMPIVGIDMSELPFAVDDFAQFVWQLSRVMKTDLAYPILLDDHGTICDGWHRVAKAVMEGRPTIKAIRLQEMPDASGKVDTK